MITKSLYTDFTKLNVNATEPNNDYFSDYLKWVGRESSEEIPEYLIPLNPTGIYLYCFYVYGI